MKILLVDDHQIYLEGLTNVLNASDIEVEIYSATSIDQVFEVLAKTFIKLILLDININSMNSLDYIDRIRSYGDPKIIILTSYDSQNIMGQAIEKNIDGFLTKTSDKDEIISAITVVMNGQKYIGNVTRDIGNIRDEFLEGSSFTARELDVLKLLAKGYTNSKIAEELFISIHTVLSHRKNMFKKLDIHSVNELIVFAYKKNLI